MWFQLFMWVVSFVLSDYFRERLPSQTASGIGDFNIPTATEGRVVPIIPGGTVRVEAPNCVWYGDFAAVERTVTTGVIFKEEETIGFTYELALQYALCKNEVAGIVGVWIGDDEVFNHVTDAGGIPQTVVDIDRDDLFGGVDNGGGFVGRLRLHNGSDTQAVSAFLNSRISPLPAYRGTAYVVITDLSETVGANIGESNNLRYIRVAVQAFDTIANGGLGNRLGLAGNTHFIGPDANPISVAYELYLNERWGRNFPPSDVDTPSFQAAAATVFAEGIGFSQAIDEQTTTGQIQDTIEQHVDGYIGPNPITGRIEVTLARLDYVLASEFQANATNIVAIKKWSKGDWSQTFNRIRIRYTDRAKQWNETHAVELAPGNRIIQGGKTKTKELRFQGVHTAQVASNIAARTRRQFAQPVGSGTIELDRTSYALRPGSIISLTDPKINEVNLAVRITKATVGNVQKNTMEFEVAQDVFDTDTATVTVTPPSDFVPPIQVVIPFGVNDQAAFETPFILMRYDLNPNSVPRISTLARRNIGNTPTEYEVVRRVRNPPAAFAGGYVSTDFVRGGFMQVGTLRGALTSWQTGNGSFSIQVDPITGSLDGLIDTYAPGPGDAAGIAVISPGLADEEFIIFDEIVDDGAGIRLENTWRAAMDTPMKPHAIGAQVWFIWTGGLGMGGETYNIGDGVDLKFLPRSPSDAVLEAAATSLPEVSLDEFTGPRNSKPLLPITMNINAQVFPTAVDFERLITAGPNTGLAGGQSVPQLRAYNNQNILTSLQALAFDQTGFNPTDVTEQVLELAWWIHDLDVDPTAARSNALALSAGYVAQATATDQFDVLKSAMIAGGAVGFSFNARLEVETRHSPAGQAALQISHDTMDLDFVANGIFSVLPSAPILSLRFDGADASTVIVDGSKYLVPVVANGSTEIDTAQSVFGGASLLVVDAAGNGIITRARREFDIRGNFTIEARLFFVSEASFPMIFEQWDNTIERGIQFYYEPGTNTFRANISTSGTNLVAFAVHTGTFVPTLSTWYAIALVKNGTSWSCYIDGTRLGTAVTQASVYFRSSADFRIGGGGDLVNFFDGNIDEFRLVPAAVRSGASYTLDTIPFPDGRALYPLLAHFDDTLGVTTYPSDEPNHFQVMIGGTSEIDTAQSQFGGSSMRSDGVGNLTVALCDGAWLPETVGFAHPSFDFKRGNWTMECFFRFAVAPGADMCLIGKNSRSTGGRNDWTWYINSATQITFSRATLPAGQWADQTEFHATVPAMSSGVWYHAAMVRVGNDLHFYFEGNRVSQLVDHFLSTPRMYNNDQSGQDPLTTPGQPVTIGRIYGTTSGAAALIPFNGWIDEVNIENRAIYNGSSYTIPVAPYATPNDGLTADPDDFGFLWLADVGPDAFATDLVLQTDDLRGAWLTFVGNAQMDDDVAGALQGGDNITVRFDGTGDYMQWTRSESVALVDDDFTIEARAYFTDDPDQNGGANLIAHWLATGNLRGFHFSVMDNAGPPHSLEFHWSTNGTDDKRVFTAFTPTLNQWYHLAVVRSGSSVFLFVDGVVQTNDGASDAITTDIINTPFRVWTMGHANDTAGNLYMEGNLQNIAWTRSAKWVSGFTPPTALYTPPALPNF